MNCQNCGHTITGNYCSNCGQVVELHRIDKKYAIQEFLNFIGYEKGFIFTCKELIIRPGKVISEYINQNRQKITKPITFIILTSVIYTFISHYLKTEEIHSNLSKSIYQDSSVYHIANWIQNNYGHANLIMILPITLCTKFIFRKYKYNFYETFVQISFIMGIGMLIFSLEPLLNKFFPHTFMINETIVASIVFIYMGWAIGQFYEKKMKNYFKALLAYFFGMLTFQVLIIGIGTLYDIIIKK
ncbi:DUF3667 domain-containing protein [Flavobacterium sp. U410]